MPGMYAPGEYDLAGFAVGVVERDRIIDGRAIVAGDVVLGLASSGPHSNGFSLIRKIVAASGADYRPPFAPADGLDHAGRRADGARRASTSSRCWRCCASSRSRAWPTSPAADSSRTSRACLPPGLQARLARDAWTRPAIFAWLQRHGNVADAEMHRVFNCGIGMAVVVARRTRGACAAPPRRRRRARHAHRRHRPATRRRARHGRRLTPHAAGRAGAMAKRITVLLSGRGTNLAALLAAMREGTLGGEINRVISNVPDAPGLALARAHGVEATAVDHRGFPTRDAFDHELALAIDAARPDRRGHGRIHARARRIVRAPLCQPAHQRASFAAAAVSRACTRTGARWRTARASTAARSIS